MFKHRIISSLFNFFVLFLSRSKVKFYLIYYCLAGFDILMVLVSLSINHFNLLSFEESISGNRVFVEATRTSEKLAELAALVNAPGNDVFDSQDAGKERLRMVHAIKDYQAFVKTTVTQFKELDRIDLRKQGLIQKSLDQVDIDMKLMVNVASQIFNHFEQKDGYKRAASKMATMDQRYADLNRSLSKLRMNLNEMQAAHLLNQSQRVGQLNKYEIFLEVSVLLMLSLVIWFGHNIGRKEENQERVLRQNSKMVALGEMAGGVAHEINNPLAIVRTKASQLRRLIESDRFQGSQGITFLKEIENTTIRMSRIVDGLRTFSRSSGDEPMIQVSLRQISMDVQGLCQERLRNQGVNFEIRIDEDYQLYCRPVQIEQILVNLVNNAFDANEGKPGAWIRVEARSSAKNQVEILVTDSGTGIPENVANKLMQPFFTTKPVGKGTGLGLSISMGIAESHSGSLRLNRESSNTQFILTLPLLGVGADHKKSTAA